MLREWKIGVFHRRKMWMKNRFAFLFIATALLALMAGIFFGMIGSLQYLLPGFLKAHLDFTKTRPLHVTLTVTWIFTAAAGGIYYYLPRREGKKFPSERLAWIHWILFVLTGVGILWSYALGYFGGREYLEFPPVLALTMMATWILFMVQVFASLPGKPAQWPVYYWMWATGLVFFFLTFAESYLWMLPWFQRNEVRDVTVQWKAMGALVGSWNMLVYGTGFYVMEKIDGNGKVTRSKLTFFFFFLGFTNLLFNWGHHTYIVPAANWIRHVAYLISMTELLILGNILFSWRKTLRKAVVQFHQLPCRFLTAADVWIFLNLCLALAISVPSINYYTHGTHITVAHAMGTTIGINTMILFASLVYIAEESGMPGFVKMKKFVRAGFWTTNSMLLIFWVSLLGAGVVKAIEKDQSLPFQVILQKLSPWFHAFAFTGLGLLAGIVLIAWPLFLLFSGKRS